MTRKSKQPGGHNPLTYHEQKRLKSSGYGTQSTRLTSASQLPFGHCCLNLSPIDGDAVATPSGHIYSREAIVQYLLTKNGELKKQKAAYERARLEVENKRVEWEESENKRRREEFVRKDQGAMRMRTANSSSTALVVREDDGGGSGASSIANSAKAASSSSATASTGKGTGENSLKHVSYWLATSQPQHQKTGSAAAAIAAGTTSTGGFDYAAAIAALPSPPPDRPPSPMSGEPLKLKQLIPLHLVHDRATKKDGTTSTKSTGRILCAVSQKNITTQPAIVLKNTGQVMLKSVYKELAKPTMTCPITGKKFKEKDVVELSKGKSGFAASGEVIAKKYNPTLT